MIDMKTAEYRSYSNIRPASEVLKAGQNQLSEHSEQLNIWYEDLQRYERCLEEMAAVTLDQSFKEELQHVDQWFCYLSDAERTATIYTLLQHSTPVQTRFFMNILQQQKKRDSVMTLSEPDPSPFQRAENEASQRLMNVLPYKTGQTTSHNKLMGNHPASRSMPAFDRHSMALGDLDDQTVPTSMGNFYSHPLASSSQLSVPRPTTTHSTTLTSPRTATFPRSTASRPSSGVDMDSPDFFSAWRSQQRNSTIGSIGDRASIIERPKSADMFGERNGSSTSLASHPFQPWGSGVELGLQYDKPLPRIATLAENEEEEDLLAPTPTAYPHLLTSVPNSPSFQPSRPAGQLTPAAAFAQYYSSHGSAAGAMAGPSASASVSPMPSLSTPTNYGRPTKKDSKQFGTFLDPRDAYGDDGGLSDHSETSSYKSSNSHKKYHHSKYHRHHSKSKERKHNDNVVNMELLKDIPAWLRSLRLHKYNAIFEKLSWQDIVKMDDQKLQDQGVAALGARRKMLKVFENVKLYCEENNISY